MYGKLRNIYLLSFIFCIVTSIPISGFYMFIGRIIDVVLLFLSIYILIKQEKYISKIASILVIISFCFFWIPVIISLVVIIILNFDLQGFSSINVLTGFYFMLIFFLFISWILRILAAVFFYINFRNIKD